MLTFQSTKSFNVRCVWIGRHTEDGSAPSVGFHVHVHNPLRLPVQLHPSSISRGADSKPKTTKRVEGTTRSTAELKRRFASVKKMAGGIIADVARGDFALCDDSVESGFLFANMIGPSPKRRLGVRDPLLATVVALSVWPALRRRWDKMSKDDGIHANGTNNGLAGTQGGAKPMFCANLKPSRNASTQSG